MPQAKKISCLVIDDEPLARDVLKKYIEGVALLHLSGECSNAVETLSFLQNNSVELLFLDINMPGINGIDCLKSIRAEKKFESLPIIIGRPSLFRAFKGVERSTWLIVIAAAGLLAFAAVLLA